MSIWRTIFVAFRTELFGRKPEAFDREWPRCPLCLKRVPALCTDAEEGAEPCGNGLTCGCCTGPHRAPKPTE